MRRIGIVGLSLVALAAGTGCAGATIQPGHRAILFNPGDNGLRPEVIQPGWVRLSCPIWTPDDKCPRVDDFDVTYQTSNEKFHVLSKEGLPMDVQIAVTYRPIVAELYLLDTEIGHHYFDKVIGPEFRNAAIGVFSKESYQDLQRKNGEIESKIQKRLQDRLKGKHLEVSSVFIQHVSYDNAILQAQQQEVVSKQETQTKNQLLENEAMQKKRELELTAENKKLELQTNADLKKRELAAQTEQKKMELSAEDEQKRLAMKTELDLRKIEIQKDTDEEKFRLDSELRNKQTERKLTREQAQIDKMKAEGDAATQLAQARGESRARLALAKASAAETAATAANITPMQVEMHAYDALGKLGGQGTTVMMGDWSKLPNWLFPRVPGFQTAFSPMYALPAPVVTAPGAEGGGTAMNGSTDNPYRR